MPSDQPPGRTERRTSGPEPLLPSAERDKIVQRLRHAINTFADAPRQALEEAESAFDEATAQLANALAEQRRALRAGWQEGEGGGEGDQGSGTQPAEAQTAEAQTPEAQALEAQVAEAQAAEAQTLDAQSAELRLALRQYREITQRLLRL
ncbi:hypothetical protein [Streptomyces sp. NPDC002845]